MPADNVAASTGCRLAPPMDGQGLPLLHQQGGRAAVVGAKLGALVQHNQAPRSPARAAIRCPHTAR